ncbi:Msr family ABC-F type ribosomal protection protein [Paenibacillus sp. N3/727]|uniref:Msr family ABC-F type ribosomal protection protein n=1 Tax=Paenibacillus sp. N3/727 TaxID=2925845 RepID=UPI001F53D550|nr:Msr family ABC-F type ribosomal protection protein [Paenibacillus sp. N3/727]UNK21032.1 Msr family ABC-F type ribosomal protection protein [Paenibacillus sp. N3/727]
MLLIKAESIYVEYLGRDVLDIDQLELYDYDRIGLVGANGAGKSTLLKALLGQISLQQGTLKREGSFTYIPQLEEAIVQDVQDHAIMGKLGVERVQTESMSGGEETRLKIAQALSEEAHGIFADEPTCHLDREGIDFLVNRLKHYAGALLIISHDRYFLDRVVDKIWELKDGRITEYWGGYTDYLAQKEEELQRQAAQYKQYVVERERLEQAIEEKKSQARKLDQRTKGADRKNSTDSGGRLGHQKSQGSKQKKLHNAAQNMERRIEALGEVDAPEAKRNVQFRQSKALELHNPFPIVGKDLHKRFGDKVIFDNVSFQFPLGSKIAITGANGVGKTTLFNMIRDRENGITISPKAEIGCFVQTSYKFERNQKVMAFMQENCEYPVSDIRAVLASMGFTHQDVRKELVVLSGGEIIKLQLAKLLLGRYNILLMDEPSNFLDIPALEALETMMQNYLGTIVFISHDARLIEGIADQVYEVNNDRLVRLK